MFINILKYSFFISLFFIGITTSSLGQNLPSEPNGHVSDFADMLTSAEQNQLETKLRNYRDTTTSVIAVSTLESLNGISIEEAATTLFNNWKLWEGDKDNGVLILVASQEREMRIEVGYGLEGAIPDVMAGRIVREILTPHFREADYYNGLDRATSAIIQLASGEFRGELAQNNTTTQDDDMASFIIFILFIIFVVYSSSRGGGRGNGRRRRRTLGPGGFIFLGGGGFGGHSGGGGGSFGGFGGGGGFGSGGGGASGGW